MSFLTPDDDNDYGVPPSVSRLYRKPVFSEFLRDSRRRYPRSLRQRSIRLTVSVSVECVCLSFLCRSRFTSLQVILRLGWLPERTFNQIRVVRGKYARAPVKSKRQWARSMGSTKRFRLDGEPSEGRADILCGVKRFVTRSWRFAESLN